MKRCRTGGSSAHIERRWPIPVLPDRGSAAVELIVLVPVLLVLVLFVVFVGRLAQASTTVRHAADQAARSASQVSTGAMSGVATTTALSELAAGGLSCVAPEVHVSRNEVQGTSAIAVTVSCAVNRQALVPLAPGVHHVSATSTEVVDVRRGDGLP